MDMREVLQAMRINGLHDEAAAVGIVMQQRAELLEALKLGLEYWQDRQQRYRNRSPVWVQKARAAITKAESAE